MLGITFKGALGIGDQVQFSSFPENHFRNTGEKVVDIDRSWVFDHNPFVIRDRAPQQVVDLWTEPWPARHSTAEEYRRKPVFFSLAERTCSIFGHTAYLRHPRLYRFEDLPRMEKRLVLHTTGKKIPPRAALGEDRQRALSQEIIDYIRHRYRGYEIIQIGALDDLDAHVIDCRGLPEIWQVARIVAQASIFIGVDSGPYWISACYPAVFRKKVMMQYPPEYLRDHFVPMHVPNNHVHWHDLSCLYYNRSQDDAGVTYSYLKL